MSKNHSVFITIKNQYKDYVECLKVIDMIKSCCFDMDKVDDSKFNLEVMNYRSNVIVPNKLEEPLDGFDIKSSISIIEKREWLNNQKRYFSNSHIHVRILYANRDMSDYLKNLHYLSLLLCKCKNLISQKRLSAFLAPRTGSEYPFSNGNETDTELYFAASVRMRAFIGKENQGVIYGVAASVTLENTNVVKALDYKKRLPVTSDCFPVIYLQGGISFSENLTRKYFFHEKSRDHKDVFAPNEIDNLNLYSLLFHNGVVDGYLKEICDLGNKRRFRFSNSEDPRLALVDYIFEVSVACLKEKKLNLSILTEIPPNAANSFVYKEIGKMNIFTFALFAFLFSFPVCGSVDNTIKENIILAEEISNALNQIVQNSLQHSAEKVCVISFLKKHTEDNKEQLKIIISDLGNKTILDSFSEQLQSEQNMLIQLNSVLDLDFTNIAISNEKMLNFNELIELKHFFNNFKDCGIDALRLWKNFRQNDSSAHIGLALFAQIMERCCAEYIVVTSANYDCREKNVYYVGENECGKVAETIPGTEFNISIPIKKLENVKPFSLSQLNNGRYCENYDSYADFLDFKLCLIDVSDNLLDKIRLLFNKCEEILFDKKLDKFSQQLIFTKFWLYIFDALDDNDLSKSIFDLDFSKIVFKPGYLENSDIHREVVVKGFLNAIAMFSVANKGCDIYLAITHLSKEMMCSFQNILLSLSIKNFPENLQLFLAGSGDLNPSNIQMHLVGSTYGQAIQNAFVISIENGVESFEPSAYLSATHLCKPFEGLINLSDSSKLVSIAPFTMFITDSYGEINDFFKNVKEISERELICGNGYKICNTHTRLGNKVHTNAFYEMSFLFYRTIMANRVAFEIIRRLMKEDADIDIINDHILFYGYASYSQAILTSLTNILKNYREKKNSVEDIYYAVYQYNLQSESNADDIQVYLNEKNICDTQIKIVQIVPISSTLTTFEKMWTKFKEKINLQNYKLVRNYSVIWVRDDINDESKKGSNIVPKTDSFLELIRTEIEDKYYIPYKHNRIETRFPHLEDAKCKYVDYIISTNSLWQTPERCKNCYPDNVMDEKPLIETDPTSTVPSQQITLSLAQNSNANYAVDKDNLQRLSNIKGNVYYGHFKRGKNHFQFYIDTINYFSKVEKDVKDWLKNISEEHRKNAIGMDMPYQSVIFSPEHNTNVGFSQYVNAYYFNGTAEIISLNEDKEFRSNFICEHAALKNTIERMFFSFGGVSNKKYLPVKFYFVDDNIITGTTLHKASSLLQSLIPKEYIHLYTTIVFEKCFFLIDRLSDSSKISYVIPTDNFISFCHINVSNTRKQGDSCVGCKIHNQVKKFAAHSATNYMADFWSEKVHEYEPKSFETLENLKDDKSYYMLVLSHVLKDLFSLNQAGNSQTFYVMITDFFIYLSNKGKSTKCVYLSFFEQYSILWDTGCSDKDHQKMLIECLLKIISRPFFTYNFIIRSQALRFIISVSEHILYPLTDMKTSSAEDSILALYSGNDIELLTFLKKNIFGALTDLHSTYLIRKKTIKGVLLFINRYAVDSKQFWKEYTIYVKEIIDGSADESRCFWLEHLLNTGYEITTDKITSDENVRLFDRIISEIPSNELNEETEKNFKCFLELLLIENERILFDHEDYSKTSVYDAVDMNGEQYYFAKRWEKFIELDLLSTGKPYVKTGSSNSNLLFRYLNRNIEKRHSHNDSTKEKDIIRERYDRLLRETHRMICNKYDIDKKNIRIAILTCSGEKQNTPRVSEFDVVSETIHSENSYDYSISKYIIKERIVKALSDESIKNSLMENGYYLCMPSNCRDDEYIKAQGEHNYNSQNHRKPYIIMYFTISDNMIFANTKLKHIIPVYLYISMINQNAKAREVMPALIVRDILLNKDALNRFFVADFTSDVLQRYAHSIGTEAILKNEKEISHSSLSNDSTQIEQIMKMDNKQLDSKCANKSITKEKMLEWFTVRNYCNMVTARLHNRVMRNFSKDLETIISESENSNSVKLYVEAKYNDGFSIPLSNLSEILPTKNTDDYIFGLFQQIINFEGVDELCDNRSPVVINLKGRKYTYNRDYTKNLIYRICFDALRFSRGAGAEHDDFVKRISNHYSLKNVSNFAASKEKVSESGRLILSHYLGIVPCRMQFSIEEGTEYFDWLVIKNDLSVPEDQKAVLDSIRKKLSDPLDFSDGHMSLLAHKEFLFKLFADLDNDWCMEMYSYSNEDGKEYFITRLPIIDKSGGNN